MTDHREALVLVSYGSHGIVELADGSHLECKYRRQVGRPFCGDRVRVTRESDDAGVVDFIHPRHNRFVRADAQQRQHVIAANLDQVLIVLALRPLPSRDLLDRYLLAVLSLRIRPVIVLNKLDLGRPPGDSAGGAVIGRLPEYRELGYPVVQTSCKGAPGITSLEPVLRNRTSILVGQSGVGKSSLVRALLPDLEIQTGELSRVTGKGTHTTTTTVLYTLAGGGHLMDSPGVWEYGLWKLEDREIAVGFPEFEQYGIACRFNDCLHRTEPGCAVKAAVAAGSIRQWRYDAYLRLLEQN
jgi:ribosome biogenesis GTPase